MSEFMNDETDCFWKKLPIICRSDQDIEILLGDIFELSGYSNEFDYSKLFQTKDNNGDLIIDTIAKIKEFKNRVNSTRKYKINMFCFFFKFIKYF